MSRASTTKLYRTFVKGLITEAGPLTYPDDATINEDNMVLFQNGNRRRRLGIDFEHGGGPSTFSVAAEDMPTIALMEAVWTSANNDDTQNFLVLQTGSKLRFFYLSQTDEIVSTHNESWVIDLADFAINGQETKNDPCQIDSGKGYLFVVHPKCDPFMVILNTTTNTISTQRIYIQVRDFKGVDDGLANDAEPTTLSAEHQYNLQNQGWIDPANDGTGTSSTYYTPFGAKDTYIAPTSAVITTYHTSTSRYPGNNKQWWVAKDASGTFDPALLTKFFSGNAHAPRGHYVLEAFNKDRSAVSGVAGLPVEQTNSRPPCVAFYGGRVWYGMDSTVYYSQLLDDKRKAGFCYMEADPTSEDISDLISTDGGEIPIPEMIKIRRMVPLAGGIMCFASNGVWFIGGTANSGFSAVDFSVTKVNPIGTDSPFSITHVQTGNNDMILWWSETGIQAMRQSFGSFGPVSGAFDSTIISLTTIQTFYNSIPKDKLPYVKSIYDPSSNVVKWLFNDGSIGYNYVYNRILNYDLTLSAFYPWTVSNRGDTIGPFVSGVFKPVVSTGLKDEFTKFVVISKADPSFSILFAEVNNTTFADWGTEAYTSFLETGYELLDDAMRNKQAMYVFCYFKRTEQNYLASGSDYIVDYPSSCMMQIKWDWSDTSMSNRWSTKREVYRISRIPPVDPSDLTFNNGFPVVVSRNKVRGHGKAIQFRFENGNIGSDFDLLGWQVPYSGNTAP